LPTAATATPVASSLDGDRLTPVFRAHYGLIWRTLRRYGVGLDVVDDVAQKVYLTFARCADRIDLGKERAFLLQTALRLAANARRSKQRSVEEASGDALVELVAPAPSPEDRLEQQERLALLDSILCKLSDEQRIVLILSRIEGLSRSELADILRIPEGTAASRLRLAAKRFEEELTQVTAAPKRKGWFR
jgi:RNA polymerase sigma-70 factor, ECF subfamily